MLYGNQRATVAEETVERIAEMIRSGQYGPGDRLPSERQLAQQLQVSRTSVREALSRLQTLGLLEGRHGLGTFVKVPSSEIIQASLFPHILSDKKTLEKLFEIREIIEIEAAARAAKRATPYHLSIMRHWVEEMETYIARNNIDGIVTADVEFHRQVIIATGNQILVDLMDSIADLLRAMRHDSILPELLSEQTAGHRAILTEIEAGRSHGARKAMRDHLSSVMFRVRAAWSENDRAVKKYKNDLLNTTQIGEV